MKKVSIFFTFLIITLFTTSCDKEETTTYWVNPEPFPLHYMDGPVPLPNIVSNEHTTNVLPSNGRVENHGKVRGENYLHFEDLLHFSMFMGLSSREQDFQKAWKGEITNFYSLEDEIEGIFSSYDKIGKRIERQFPTLESISPEIEKSIDKEIEDLLTPYTSIIFYEKAEGIERKTFSITIDFLLNKDGIVQIGQDIYQFSHDNIKIIKGGDPTKIPLLTEVAETDEQQGISVHPVIHERNKQINDGGRLEGVEAYWIPSFFSISSCISTEGRYRTIAYEEKASSFLNSATPNYGSVFTAYRIQLRSLKKSGWWYFNEQTGQLDSQGSYSAAFNPVSNPIISYYSAPYSETKHTHYVDLVHTVRVDNVHISEFASRSEIYWSDHTSRGKGGTGCSFGK